MIKSGISDKTIEEQCGKIGEEEKVSEKIEKTEDEKMETLGLLELLEHQTKSEE
jgi:hypothetical protein